MVKNGLAFDYPRYSHGKYAAEQNEAKAAKKGVWVQSEGAIKTWDARNKH
jgi:endonuclease YncB( thermonuclease family)